MSADEKTLKIINRFVDPSAKAASTFIPAEMRVCEGEVSTEGILVENRAVFDLVEIQQAAQEEIDTIAAAFEVTKNKVISAILIHLIKNGSARQVNTEGFDIAFNTAGKMRAADGTAYKAQMLDNGQGKVILKIGVSPLLRKIEATAAKQYQGMSGSEHSSSGSKLFMRSFSHFVPFILKKSAGDDYSKMKAMSKIASKINLNDPKDIVLATQATPDYHSLSRADGFRYMRIMAVYMQRSRSGKNKVDKIGKEIDKKDIFISLCERIVLVHSQVTGYTNGIGEQIWASPSLDSADKADLGTRIIIGRSDKGEPLIETLAAFFRSGEATTSVTASGSNSESN